MLSNKALGLITCKILIIHHPIPTQIVSHTDSPTTAPTWLGGCRTGVRCGVWHLTWLLARRCRVWAFFFSDSRQLGFDSRWTGVIRPESGRIGRQLKRWKQAEIGLESCRNNRNRLWMRPKHPKSVLPQFYSEYLLLLLCFLFCFVFLAFFFLCFVNQGHSNVFFKNILIVKIYRKYK